MVKTDGSIPMINLFKQKRTKGWWPLYIKTDDRSAEEEGGLVLQVKIIVCYSIFTYQEIFDKSMSTYYKMYETHQHFPG